MHLLVCDFDGTMANTMRAQDQYGNEIGVLPACDFAVEQMFGAEGLAYYRETGGLRNETPGQVVRRVLSFDPKMVEVGRDFFFRNSSKYEGHVPLGLGGSFEWVDGCEDVALTELWVRLKLQRLTDQIGTETVDGSIWPDEMPGLSDFWRHASGDEQIVIGVVSSGHDLFISKWLEARGLVQPDILISDDIIRGLSYPEGQSYLSKPGPLPLHLAYEGFRNLYGDELDSFVMIGDDAYKDGRMAWRGGAQFIHFDGRREDPFIHFDHELRFNDWSYLQEALEHTHTTMRDGVGLYELVRELLSSEIGRRGVER